MKELCTLDSPFIEISVFLHDSPSQHSQIFYLMDQPLSSGSPPLTFFLHWLEPPMFLSRKKM